MEREFFTPEELTQQGQNAYSRSMPETVDIPGGGAPEAPSLGQRGPENPRPSLDEIVNQMADQARAQGLDVDADTLRTFRMAAAMGWGPQQFGQTENGARGGQGNQPRDPRTDDNIDFDAARSVLDESTISEMGQRDLEKNKADIIKALEKPGGRYLKSSEIADPDLKAILQKAERLHIDSVRKNDPYQLEELKKALRQYENRPLTDEQRRETDNIFQHLEALQKVIYIDTPLSEEQARYTFRLTLTESDFDDINEDPLNWMSSQMDRVYNFSRQGAEMNSPQVSAAQSLVQTAQRYMILSKWGREDPEMVQRFGEEFSYRLQLMFQAGTIKRKNMEGAKGLAQNIGVHGILSALSFEDGMVNRLQSRMADLYDDMRVRSLDQHITAEEHSTLQDRLVEEFELLHKRGVSVVRLGKNAASASKERRDQLAKDQITRAVRGAYDLFVAGQREGVIVARGKALNSGHTAEGIIADPSALFQAFNIEQMLIAKFGLLNHSQEQFYKALKRRYAENTLKNKNIDLNEWANARAALDPSIRYKLDDHSKPVVKDGKAVEYSQDELTRAELVKYGSDLMKDLMLVNDFYSSPWRMERFFAQIDNVVKYNYVKASYLAQHPEGYNQRLGRLEEEASREIKERLHHLSDEEANALTAKSNEFALFMRLRFIHKDHHNNHKEASKKEVFEAIAKYKPEDIVKIFRGMGYPSELESVNEMLAQNGIEPPHHASGGHGPELTHYDVFKDKYGSVIRLLREHGFEQPNPEQVDLSQIMSKPEYVEIFNKAMGVEDNDTSEVQKFTTIMAGLSRFAADTTEGGTIDKLVRDSRFEGIYSRSYAIDDALLDKLENVDRRAGMKSLSELLGPEPGGDGYARTFNDAEAAAQAHTGLIKFLRDKSFEDKLKDSLEIAEIVSHYGGPGDRARVFRRLGAEMMLMGNVEDNNLGLVYAMLDVKHKPGNKPINELQRIFGIHAPAYNREDYYHFVHEYEQDLEGSDAALFHEVERLARVTPRNRKEMLALKLSLYFLLFILLESGHDLKAGLDVDVAGGGGGGGGGGGHH